jgi:hypothetical protein
MKSSIIKVFRELRSVLPIFLGLLGSPTLLLAQFSSQTGHSVDENPFGEVVKAGFTIKTLALAGVCVLVGLSSVIGGGIAAWKLMKGKPDWEQQLLYSILGFVVAVVAGMATWGTTYSGDGG